MTPGDGERTQLAVVPSDSRGDESGSSLVASSALA